MNTGFFNICIEIYEFSWRGIKQRLLFKQEMDIFSNIRYFYLKNIKFYLVKEELNRDCIIQTRDGYFLCHKIVLAASNGFFRQVENCIYLLSKVKYFRYH